MQTLSNTVIGRFLTRELHPGQLMSAISAGLVAAVIHVILPVSFAALVFSGRTSGFISRGIGLILLGSIGAMIVVNLLSTFSGTLTAVQNAPGTVVAVISTGLMSSLPASTPTRDVFYTITAAMAISTLLTGIACLLLGQFRLGSLIRYLPYPVIGGFLAGTGWVLITGGIGMMSGSDMSLSSLPALIEPSMLLRWLPGILLGVGMVAATNRYHHILVLPGIILGSVAVFFAVTLLSGVPLSQLTAGGWLLGPLPPGALWQPPSPADLAGIQWKMLLAQSGSLLSVVLVSTVSFLLNLSGIEVAVQRDMDLERELKAVGLGNMLSGLLGGIVNFHALSTTMLNHRLGRDSRITGWVVVVLSTMVLFLGASLLSFAPKMILGGLLAFLGFSFLYEWVFQAWQRFTRVEYAILLAILAVIAGFGYLTGVGVGLLAAVGLFVVDYSQVNVVKHILTGAEYQSRVIRSAQQKMLLEQHGKSLLILQLQGYIFFGTANRLLELIRQRTSASQPSENQPLETIILDFRLVSGLDSTALLSFQKLDQISRLHGFQLALSSLSPHLRRMFEKTDLVTPRGEIRCFPDLDHAVEWFEKCFLEACSVPTLHQTLSLAVELQRIFPEQDRIQHLLGYFERMDLAAGDYLIHQGDEPEEIYFIEDGQLTAQLEPPGRDPIRLETMFGGRAVGELGFTLGIRRTASVVADQPSVVYRLSREHLRAIEQADSPSAAAFHQVLAYLLAERTTHLIDSVNALQR
jgi:SulP family sulfate permease